MSNVGIYTITSPSENIYVGQSRNLKKRFNAYKNQLASTQPLLHRSFKKYGFAAHEINIILYLDKNVTQPIIDYWEQFFISFYKNQGHVMLNNKMGGQHFFYVRKKAGRKLTEEEKDRVRKRMTGRIVTEETKQKLSLSHTGKKRVSFSEEHKRKIGLANKNSKGSKGRIIKDSTREKLRLLNLGKKHSEETKLKLSKLLLGSKRRLGCKHSEEAKVKMSLAKRGSKSLSAKLNESQVKAIITSIKLGTSTRDLAILFGVPIDLIQSIKAGRTWNHLTKVKSESYA